MENNKQTTPTTNVTEFQAGYTKENVSRVANIKKTSPQWDTPKATPQASRKRDYTKAHQEHHSQHQAH